MSTPHFAESIVTDRGLDGPLQDESFRQYIRHGASQRVMSEGNGTFAGTDFVGLAFNLIIFVLFVGSLVAAWYVA